MKKFATVAVAAALFATPAIANAQAFVQAEAGLDVVSMEGESEANVTYGATVGYDYALSGGMFIGAQASFSDSEAKRCVKDSGEDYSIKGCLEAGRDVSVLARLGTSVGEKGKLYLLAGYSNLRMEGVVTNSDLDGKVTVSQDLDGVRVGAGYEHALSEQFFLKAEYRYSNYAYDVSRHQGVLAIGTKF